MMIDMSSIKKQRLKGIVTSGIKKGAYYVNLEPYRSFFKEILGRDPFPGTLNILLNKGINANDILSQRYIPSNEKLSPLSYTIGYVNGKKVIVLKPDITIHNGNIIEIVSDVKLREKFNLKDGDLVEIVIEAP